MKRGYWMALGVLLVATMVASYWHDSTHFPAFYALFGLAGAVALIVLAKLVGKRFLMRKEDYYDES